MAPPASFASVSDGSFPADQAKTLRVPSPVVLHARVVTGAGGGPDKTILNSPRFLRPMGYRTVCGFLRPPRDMGFETLRQRATACDAPIIEIDDRGPWDAGVVACVNKIVGDLNVDVWHAHDYKTNLLGLLVRRQRPIKLITTCHGWVQRTWRTIAYHQLDRFTLQRYDRVIAVSTDIAATCRRLGVNESRLALIENAIDTEQYFRFRTAREAKLEFGWPADRKLIGAVGRLSAEKGFDLLIRAVARLVQNGRGIGLVIAGDGPEASSLKRLIADLQLADRVQLVGFQAELIPFYEAIDVFALSSRREGLPNVLLEAMALETPVVSTRVAGVPSLIEDGVNGLLTSIEDVDGLAATIARVLDDEEFGRRLAKAARDTVVSRFSFAKRMAKIAAIYDDVLRNAVAMTSEVRACDSPTASLDVVVHEGSSAAAGRPQWDDLRRRCGAVSPSLRHDWLSILRDGLDHAPYCIEARMGEDPVGLLPLCFVRSRLFGKFLVGMPYLNVGGVLAVDDHVGARLIDRSVQLADELDVRYLELRHERHWRHPALGHESTQKAHLRLELPPDAESLWASFKPKVRNQIRKAEQHGLTVRWGSHDLLAQFYRIFSVNMRDLGTPVFGRRLFSAMLTRLGRDAEICIVRRNDLPLAAGIVVYGDGVAEVPSASSLRRYNHLNANMLLYWHLLVRSIQRKQGVFDFGRSSVGSSTYRFKTQWGAEPHPAVWQYYVRQGSVGEMRPDNPKLQRRIAVWRRLPVWLTRLAGPPIVRGIP